MNFYTKLLIIVFLSFTCFVLSTQAQAENNYLSIPEFPLRRVTPEKIAPSEAKDKVTVKKELPKLRIVEQTEQKIKPQPAPVKQEKKPTEISADTQTTSQISKSETKETAKTEQIINTEEPTQSSSSPDELILKANKINETPQTAQNNSFAKSNSVQEAGNDFLKLFSSLSIVLFLIFIFAWVYARVKGINPTAILTGKFAEKDLNRFNVLSTSTLGQGKDIHLVEINGKQLVIGSTANNINLLTEIPPEEIEKLKEQRQNEQNHQNEETEKSPEPVEVQKTTDADDFYYKYIEDGEFMDADFYFSKYSEVYKEYLDRKDGKTDSENK